MKHEAQRFGFFLEENQKSVHNNKHLACIPSGLMGELLYLNYDGIDNIQLTGIDYDPEALKGAQELADQKGRSIKCIKGDAWELNYENEFDLISSNGLNIYEPDDNKVTQMYDIFYKALKPRGKLVTSFLTFPTLFPEKSEWEVSKLNKDDLLMQKIIFGDIIGAKWQCFRTTEQTRKQLESVGFVNLRFIYDDAKQFPTVVAEKEEKLSPKL